MRELRQHASRYLARVKGGETVEVTERGELVALLVPPSPSSLARDRLIAEGRIVPASAPRRPHTHDSRIKSALQTAAVLDEMRRDIDG